MRAAVITTALLAMLNASSAFMSGGAPVRNMGGTTTCLLTKKYSIRIKSKVETATLLSGFQLAVVYGVVD